MGVLVDNVRSALRSITLNGRYPGDPALRALFGGTPTSSGVSVSVESALGLSATWSCVSLISGTVAQLPLTFYRRLPNGGREPYRDHPLFDLLDARPNSEMSAVTLKEFWTVSLLLRGTAYARVMRDQGARPRALWPISPDAVAVGRRSNGGLFYRVGGRDEFEEDEGDILRIVGPNSPDGIVGRSPISAAREVFATAQALEGYGASFFAAAGAPRGVLNVPGRLSQQAAEQLRERWQAAYAGPGNWRKTALLEDGVTFAPISVSNEDSEFISSRQFSVEEVARIFNVPGSMLGAETKGSMTYANAETRAQDFLRYCIGPTLARIEDACNRVLVSSLERFQQFVEFNPNALLRPDTQTRFASYETALRSGWLSINEVRQRENLPPMPAPSSASSPDREALRQALGDACHRFAPREANRARRSSSSPERLREHLGSDYLSGAERATALEILAPLARLARPGATVRDVERWLEPILDRHCAESERELRALLVTKNGKDVTAAVTVATEKWMTERVASLTASLLEGE